MKNYLRSVVNITSVLFVMGGGCAFIAIGNLMIKYALRGLKYEWERN